MSNSFAAIDFETTGVQRGFSNLPWQLGVVFFDDQMLPKVSFDTYLCVPEDHPFNKFTPGTFASHRAEIAQAPTLPELWPHLNRILAPAWVIAHNASTERNLLARFAPLTAYSWIDTLLLSRHAFPNQPSYALEDLIPALQLQDALSALCPRAPHDATYDAFAAAILFQKIRTLPGWSQLSISDLSSIK